MGDLHSLRKAFLDEIAAVTDLAGLQQIKSRYTGKKGLLTEKLKALSAISPEERRDYGRLVNEIKDFIELTVK
ncbi:MAG: phenylalanine--tRNA ligase subunit alpha, partial [Thermodesulfovibrionales bacterium]